MWQFLIMQGSRRENLGILLRVVVLRCICHLYNVKSEIQNFDNLPDVEKLAVIVLHFEKSLICYLHNSWNIRQNVISK